jgi:hypothetical protein
MLAAARGALRRYLENRGEAVQGPTMRAGQSVDLRDPDVEASLGNQAAVVPVDLPLGLDIATNRLQHVKRRMDDLKRSPQATVNSGLLNAWGNAPVELQDTLVEAYYSRATAMITDAPGHTKEAYLASAPLETLIYWVPALGGTKRSLSVVGWAGEVSFGASSDPGLAPGTQNTIADFHAEFKAIRCSTPRGHRTGLPRP